MPNPQRLQETSVDRALFEPQVGDTLGTYSLLDEIGLGGMGRVFLARNHDDTLVALKTIRERRYELIRRLEREAHLGMAMDHPNIIRVLDSNLTAPWPYLVTEYLEGCVLEELPGFRRPMPEQPVMLMVIGIAQALLHTERLGTIHRDVKPGNIFLTFGGDVKLMDFGLALGPVGPRITSNEDLLGTIAYMAPEQIRHGTNSHQCDIYGLGVTAYELLRGRPPYVADTIPALVKQILAGESPRLRGKARSISAGAESIILRMMEPDPADRYTSFHDVIQDLRLYEEFSGLHAVPRAARRQTLRFLHSRANKSQ